VYLIGNDIANLDRNRIISLLLLLENTKMRDTPAKMCGKSIGIDPAYGSSNFGIVGTQGVDQQIQVIYAEEFERPDYNEMLWLVAKLMQQYAYVRVYIDGSNPSFIKSLKRMIGEDEHYEKYTKEQME
jgi:hypothetical protein